MGKKLIEVAPFLPLDAISVASKADKDKKTGTIKNVHKWFAPMPTPALRALIFGATVDAPEDPTEHEQLLGLVERLVPRDGNPPDKRTLKEAEEVIRASSDGTLPTIFDPFCGGGSTLIEAQRLGLPAQGSDLNPVPALITRTLTQLIPSATGRQPLVGDQAQLGSISGGHIDGLLADIQYYAEVVRGEVWKRVGHLYPLGPAGETILAWLWAWTTRCSNPACNAPLPLITSTTLSRRKGRPVALQAALVDDRVTLRLDREPIPEKGTVNRSGAKCLACGTVTKLADVRATAGRRGLGRQLLCAVGDGDSGRKFIEASELSETDLDLDGDLDVALPEQALGFRVQAYGMTAQADLYLPRQLAMLDVFADVIATVPDRVAEDGGDESYAAAVASVLGLALGKLAQSNSTQVRWKIDSRNGSAKAEPGFGRHAMPMVWDFVETNPFGGSVGDWLGQVDSILRGLTKLPDSPPPAVVSKADARSAGASVAGGALIVTDPPYFDQIGYADLSDYFYVWHRKALRKVHPDRG